MTVAALIVAAGRGTRAAGGSGTPKQYRRIGREPVLTHTLRAFLGHRDIHKLLVVIHEDDRALYDAAVRPLAGAAGERLLPPVTGGATRQASVRAGLEALREAAPSQVLIHDAARPFLTRQIIDGVLEALRDHAGALAAVPLADTLKRVAPQGCVRETVPRAGLWRAQTPQGFAFAQILAAHGAAQAAGREDFTDDAAIAEWHGLDVVVTPGSEANRKLTTSEDLEMADRDLLRAEAGVQLADVRAGSGFDVHRFGAPEQGCEQIMLCGVPIPSQRPLEGHSDADVGLHALTDALLGALADGDIGTHFPPEEGAWRNAASDIFLADAAARLRARGGVVSHADITIVCEKPRIGPHRAAMRERVAAILDIAVDRVSVKATTTEGLGFTGRGEGIAAMATVTVRLPAP